MPEMSAGTALRNLQQAQAGLKKARQVLRHAKGDPHATAGVLKVGWELLGKSHKILAEIPLTAATEPVMTKQLAVERYSTALLVRLRRLLRNDGTPDDDDDAAFEDASDNNEI